ncbi:efflux RND transporter periplasmic adaptor subunit [Microbulbifer sp. SAOS-129_SWC]|uniref:efflux RND transporter periplasmic adaptor subunit n=1 Tax=Microbulbifer sp. SAOS-129_SWC TaxID=3145235 RepID=UPI00321744F9
MGNIRTLCLALLAAVPLLAGAQAPAETAGDYADGSGAPAKLSAIHRVKLSSDLAAVITAVKVRDGDHFKRGDLLASFDCTELRAELDSAEAQRKITARQHDSNLELRRIGGNISQLELLQGEAQLADATAKAKVLKHRSGNCEVRAPFDGFVIKREVQPYQRAEVGMPLFELVDNRKLEVEAIVPSTWLSQLRAGRKFRVRINETGSTYQAQLQRIVPAVDPVTRTVRVIGIIEAPGALLIGGMSGEALFDIDATEPAAVAGVTQSER